MLTKDIYGIKKINWKFFYFTTISIFLFFIIIDFYMYFKGNIHYYPYLYERTIVFLFAVFCLIYSKKNKLTKQITNYLPIILYLIWVSFEINSRLWQFFYFKFNPIEYYRYGGILFLLCTPFLFIKDLKFIIFINVYVYTAFMSIEFLTNATDIIYIGLTYSMMISTIISIYLHNKIKQIIYKSNTNFIIKKQIKQNTINMHIIKEKTFLIATISDHLNSLFLVIINCFEYLKEYSCKKDEFNAEIDKLKKISNILSQFREKCSSLNNSKNQIETTSIFNKDNLK